METMEKLKVLDEVKSCRACGEPLHSMVADLGMQPPSNSYLASESDIGLERRYPLRAKVCENCKLVQLDYDVPPVQLFDNYAYFSSYSDEWLAHAEAYCEMASARFELTSSSLVVELASNDGYLLKNFVAGGIPVLGIDPSGTVAAAAEKLGVPTLVEFFGTGVAKSLESKGQKADLLIANNVLAHVPDLNDFVAGIGIVLKPTGTATIEFPHLLKLIQHVEFDTIYHEHFSYISILAIEKVLQRHGLEIFDAEELPTHGGSLRLYVAHASRVRSRASASLTSIRAQELDAGLNIMKTYGQFYERVEDCRKGLLKFLAQTRAEGATIACYGAAAKGNTLLNFCNLTSKELGFVADRNPHKQGKLLPGSHIPIVSPAELVAFKPDYTLILPWNFKTEIMSQLSTVRNWGGRFVTAVPAVEVY